MPELVDKDSGKNAKEEKEKFEMTISGHVYDKRDDAGKELKALTNVYHDLEPIKIGKYRGLDMTLEFNPHFALHHLTLKGNDSYRIDMGDSASGNITKLNNVLNGFEGRIAKAEEELRECANQVRLAQEQLEKPFEREDELAEKSARLAQLNLELNIDRHGGVDDEDELTLSEDEEYDYRNELEETGIDETDLFSRRKDDSDEVVVGIGEELSEQGKNDKLRAEIESGTMLDIDGTLVEDTSRNFDSIEETRTFEIRDGFAGTPEEYPLTSADLYGEKMNLSNYSEFQYPKAAQFIDIHDPREQYAYDLLDGDERIYRQILEGIVNSVMQEHRIAEQSLNPRSSNDEYHFIRDYAMTKVCKELELPYSFMPEPVSGLSGTEMAVLREKGEKLAELSLYGHLPEAERKKVLAERKSAEISEIFETDPTEERKAIIAEAKRKLAEDGAMPIITDAMEGNAYEGEILEIGSAYAVQKIDEGRGIIHNLSYLKDFKRMIDESGVPYLEISYDREMNGSIGARDTAGQGRTAAMGR
jgi:hypothetical protein